MKVFITVLLTLVLLVPSQGRVVFGSSVAQSNDSWRSVETNNLFVIGNVDAETLRQVAGWLEFFHAAFGRLVSRSVVNSTVPTRVVVFRDEPSFLPFKPLYQGKPLELSGYFQPGEDINYIAILIDRSGRERNPYSTAFHEYVHLHLRQNVSTAPLWLNEGLAEFYSSLEFSDNEAVVGAPINAYLRLLRARDMLPLDTLFSIRPDSPHYNERDKSGIFYGQSWALVHYLMMGGGQRQEQFKQFLQLISRGDSADKAIESAFGMTLSAVEKGFHDYVQRGEFSGQRITTRDSSPAYRSYTAMQRISLTDAEATYYLGDLLSHIGRDDVAERYFEKALSLDPNLATANASLGLLRVEQRRYPEAKKYLQRAVASPQNYRIHYLYAYLLSREGVQSGENTGYSRENVAIMREQLLRTIKLAPNFAAGHYLLALIDLVSDEHLDEAESMAMKAQQLAPAKRAYSILLAQIYLRRSNSEAARRVLEPLARDSDASVRTEAQELLDSLGEAAGAQRSARSQKPQLSQELIAEPEVGSTSRGIVGSTTTSTTIRDGRTIESGGALPKLEEVLARYVQAIGGETAINAVSSRVSKGTLDVVGVSRNGSFEIYAQAPNKSLTVMDAYPMGSVKMGFNGRSGWVQSAAGFRSLKTADLGALARDSDFYGKVRLKNIFPKVTLLGKSKIGYRDLYVLELQPLSGPVERLFLDVETFLPVRLDTHRNVGPQLAAVEMYFDDWRDVNGIKLPFRISQRSDGRTLYFTVTEVRHNVALNGTLFDPPMK